MLRNPFDILGLPPRFNLDEQELREQGQDLDPALIEPKEGIIREPQGFGERIRDLYDRHTG